MALQWTVEAEASLIEKIRSQPPLWNSRLPSYSKKLLKKHLYSAIAEELQEAFPNLEGITSDAVMIKFNVLKGSFRREMAKIKKIKSGSGADHLPKWKHFELMLFIADVVTPGDSTSNLDTAVTQSQSSQELMLSLSETQSSQSILIRAEPYMSDDEVIHQSAMNNNETDDTDLLPTPSGSGSSSRSSSLSETPRTLHIANTPTPPLVMTQTPPLSHTPTPTVSQTPVGAKRKRRTTSEHVPSTSEEALAILKSTVNSPRKENIPYAAGVFVREVFSEFPRHRHTAMMLKLSTFLAKLSEEEGSIRPNS